MKILITGGAGFIGSHVAEAYLNEGHDVTILDNFSTGKIENVPKGVRVWECSVNDPSITDRFMQERFDVVNHHAAQMDVRISIKDPLFDARENILGGINIYEAARLSGVKKIVFASSGGTVYGEQEYFPADERHPLRPISPYGISKLSNEQYLYYYSQVHNLPHTILRYANVYGPRQNPNGEAGVIAIFTKKILMNEQPTINGDGMQTRDYIYVGDVAAANVAALSFETTGSFNIGTGIETDVLHIFDLIRTACGVDCEANHILAKTGEQRRSSISPELFSSVTGWKPTVGLNEGMDNTTRFFRTQLQQRQYC